MSALEQNWRQRWRWKYRERLVRAALPFCVAFAMCVLLPLASYASTQAQDELAVRAAFVFNLTKYIEWTHARTQLTVGFLGDGPMGEVLKQTLAGKSSDARAIDVVLEPSEPALERCDIVYVAYASSKKNREVIEKLRNREVLTVGESDGFAKDHGMVGLVKKGNQIRIEINLEAARVAGIKVSSRLLSVATVIDAAEGRN